MGAQRDFPAVAAAGTRAGSLWRRSAAAVCICVLAGYALRGPWRVTSYEELKVLLLTLGVTLGPATAYSFGYFRCLPEVLGGSPRGQDRTLWQRWSDFARLSIAFAIGFTWIAWGIFVSPLSFTIHDAAAFAALVSGVLGVTCVMLAVVVASEEYLAHTMEPGDTAAGTDWRATVRRLVGRLGAVLLRALGAKRSLVAGSALVLTSLFTPMDDDSYKGFEALLGRTNWITAKYSELPGSLNEMVNKAGLATYGLGLALAVMALGSVLAGRAGEALRKSRWIRIVGGSLALYGICDYLFAWLRLVALRPVTLQFGAWIGAWIVPIALWLWRAPGDKKQWAYTRLAVMVFYLPIFFVCLAMLVFMVGIGPGYFSFLTGALLLWWGLLRSQWERAQRA